MRRDFTQLKDGSTVTLYPNDYNDNYTHPVGAMYVNGFFYIHGAGLKPEYTIDNVVDGFIGYRVQGEL